VANIKMKYLKRKKEITKYFSLQEIEDLEDYLQEFFDNLNISDGRDESKDGIVYRLWSSSNNDERNKKFRYVLKIENIKDNIYTKHEIYNELRMIQPLIEKRMGVNIDIMVFVGVIMLQKSNRVDESHKRI